MISAVVLGILFQFGPAAASSDVTVRIVATDEGYEHPDSISGGLSHIVFENHGSDIHELMFIKLPAGMSGANYLQAVRDGVDFPEGALDYSGPGLTVPGRQVEVWLTLDPGTYLLGCWFRGHLRDLPAQTLTVTEPVAADLAPPEHDVTLRMADFRFELEGTLKPGPQVLRIEIPGPSMHEIDIYHLHPDRTLADLKGWHKHGKKGPPPATPIGGVLDSHDISRTVWLKTRFEPGRHVLWCGMPMVQNQTGPAGDVTHADAGMVKEIEIEE